MGRRIEEEERARKGRAGRAGRIDPVPLGLFGIGVAALVVAGLTQAGTQVNRCLGTVGTSLALAGAPAAPAAPRRPGGWMGLPPLGACRPAPPAGPAPAPPASPPAETPHPRSGHGPAGFTETAETPLSTFGVDVDSGSLSLLRAFLAKGQRPPAALLRTEEVVNGLDYGFPGPREGEFAIHAEAAPSPYAPDRWLLQLVVRARDTRPGPRRPLRLTAVVDVSGSMGASDRLDLARSSLALLADQLGPEDRFALVVYGDEARTVCPGIPGSERARIHAALDAMEIEGSTNVEAGLVLGYKTAAGMFDPAATNRVVLCSDGVANVGSTSPDEILARVRADAARGIWLTTVGFGMGEYGDTLMERLADQGNGFYAYVDDPAEAHRIFVDRLAGQVDMVARDAKVQVEFAAGAVKRWRLLGYQDRRLPAAAFRDDRVDAGEVGAGHAVVAFYELEPEKGPSAALGRVRVRWQDPVGGRAAPARELAVPLAASLLGSRLEGCSIGYRTARVAATLAEVLGRVPAAAELGLGPVAAEARAISGSGLPAAAEVSGLVAKAVRLDQ